MSDQSDLMPASRADLILALSYALTHDARGKAHRRAADFMTQIAAETLADHLERSGFVILRKPAREAHRIP
jgi:hypothetical protein